MGLRPEADAGAARFQHAKILVALGDLAEAEDEVAARLEETPEDLTALNLFAKIKHMKGELSEAVACWAQLHARSPHNELALMRLAVLLELARDPERHAGNYLALGRISLGHNPTAPLELEEAFRQLLARRPHEAKATCEQLAVRHRVKDPELYKLCVMAKAWIAELSGEMDAARTILENLGKERGFETDIDRALSLVRIYERSNDPVQLEKAVHIHQFVDRTFAKLSSKAHLATLQRKLGNLELAESYERSFQIGFERRMHRPSRAEIARAAARHYVPLERLKSVRPSPEEDDQVATGRERALLDFLSGKVEPARDYFAVASECLDRKYRADLLATGGDLDAAIPLFLGALRDDPDDHHVVSFLVAHWDRTRDARVTSELAGTPLGDRVREGLEAVLYVRPRSTRTWQTLSLLFALQGRPEEAEKHRERGQALHMADQRNANPVGRVLAAAVYHFVGKAKGLIHQIWVDRKPVAPGRGGFLHAEDIFGNITKDMQQAVRNTFFAVREYARSRFPHRTADILDYDYTYKVTKEDEPSGGLSAGLPTALAFLSVFLQCPVPQDMACSGVIIADAHDVLVLRGVGEAEYKVKGAYHRNLNAIVLPRDNQNDLAQTQQVPRAIVSELVRFASNLDEAITLTFGEGIWLH
ncbi:MAG TPA: S16 family serine protease [Polyangiaceae bacterium]|nr:S16 family serine protease [Polyangiaceae bacterium]